tara:strand:+ start:2186 stop:4021 length:1836 start_codon:yes stop_codon:yes gene_type:complete
MAEKVVVELEVKSDKGVKDVKKLNKEISNTNKEIKQTQEASTQMGSTLDKATGGAVTKFKGLKGALKTAVTGFKSLRIAIIGTGIGALLIAITSLGQAFTRSEEGQNKFAKILGVIGSVTGNLLDLLADLGEGIISVFENPKQALIDFKNLIVENITNRFNAIIDTLGFLGSAFKKVFSGDFSGALEDAKKAGSSYVDSLTGVKNTLDKITESTKGFVKELKEEAKIAGQIADQRAKADKVERKLIVERAEADRKVAELREKAADKDKVSAKDRIEALEEAGRINEEITNKEIQAAKLRLEAKQSENALTKSTKADLDEEANLKARLIQLETARLRQQKSITAEISGARKQEKAELEAEAKEKQDKINKEATDENTRLEAIQKVRDDFKQKQAEKEAETELQKIDLEEQRKIAELDKLNATEQQKQEIYEYYAGLRTDVEVKENKKKEQIEKLRKQQTLNDAKNTLNQIAQLAGKDSKIGKAMAIASATISGVEGVQNAYSTAQKSPITTFFPAYPIVQGALAGAVALKNISAIKSVDPKGGGSSTIPKPSGGGGSVSQPPAFNVVGASDTNQLADAIGSQSQEPTRAYVVSNDVTTAQSMDRNIVDGASI